MKTPAADTRVDLLFEVGCEEIPAGMLPKGEEELRTNIEKLLTAESLADGVAVETFSAPRRLTAWVRGLPVKQADIETEVTGPPKSVAYDSVGAPTRAAQSFAEKQRVHVSDLYLVQTAKGEYLAAKQVRLGRTAEQILIGILPRAVHDLTWPRSMTWTGLDGPRFIRPIRWIVAVLDGKPLRVSVAGIAAGRTTRGHRFLGSSAVNVSNFLDYEKRLLQNGVIIRPTKRQDKIAAELDAHAKKGGYRIHEDASLRKLVAYLNEYPTVIQGNFDPAFLTLPDEILITVMRDHQKYFAVENKSGELTPHFLAVINVGKDSKGLIRAGHERVLRARFERIRTIGRWFTENWFNLGMVLAHVAEADRAAELAKCDLATEMVREFTELQGIVGGLYARAQGESGEIADAIYDHYRPVGLDDPIPRNLTGCAVALADKLDSVVGCFAVGVIPTGSSDPYALRRAALGIVKIILEKKLPVSLSLAIGAASKALLTHKPKRGVTPDQETQILDFILDRAKFVFREREGFGYDEVSAVFRAGADDLVDVQKRLVALKAIRKSKNFEPLAVSFKRIRKILEKANVAPGNSLHVNPELFENAAERGLHTAVRDAASKVQGQKRAGKYQEALETIAGLRKAVDHFFDGVMVMAENEAVRNNRLALLAELLREFTTVADFSEIGGEERH